MTKRRTGLSDEKRRLKELLWLMIRKFQPNCWKCGEPFVYADILPSRGVDQLTDHHLDGDHMNSDPSNRVLVHRTCHKRLHVKNNIQREESADEPEVLLHLEDNSSIAKGE